MNSVRSSVVWLLPVAVLLAQGCAASKIDFADIKRPPRSSELDAYKVFVGSWVWEAELLNAEGSDKEWHGTAEWHWTLDNRTLRGTMSSQTARSRFEAEGVWSWHPKKKKYIWSMINSWGYPQTGTARYNADAKCWKMTYHSVGLDGTTSYGQYSVTVANNDTLTWRMKEWADPLHIITKMEMTGTYKRQR